LHQCAGHGHAFDGEQVIGRKCSPTPNISSMMPISDNCEAMCTSATKPGVADR